MNYTHENSPNAAKLIESLRSTGYTPETAICDIVDNSFDASASKVNIYISKEKVVIADDGVGMPLSILDQAMRLGSLTDRSEASDLGKFGMGLTVASISLGRKLEVLTRDSEGKILYACQDLDEMKKSNSFNIFLGDAPRDKEKEFASFVTSKTGSVVIVSNIDRIHEKQVGPLCARMKSDVGRIYRKFIGAGKLIYINDELVSAVDPLWLADPGTVVYSDETYLYPKESGQEEQTTIAIKLVLLPVHSSNESRAVGITFKNQGFSLVRNEREICFGEDFGLFVKHSDFNGFRGEISFSGKLDVDMGIEFKKTTVRLSQSLTDFLKTELSSQIRAIRSRHLEAKRAISSQSDFTPAEKHIDRKAQLLQKPEPVVEPRSKEKVPGRRSEKVKEPRGTYSKKPLAKFIEINDGRDNQLYTCEQVGKTTEITYNVDHPFYEKVLGKLRNSDKDMTEALDFLFYGLATAELKNVDDDNRQLMENVRSTLSINLRVLMD